MPRPRDVVVAGAAAVVLAGAALGALLTTEEAAPGPDAGDRSEQCGGVTPSKPDGGRYSCTFSEEFDGPLEASRWMVQETWFSGMTSGNEDCYLKDPAAVNVESGVLALTARRQLPPFSCPSPRGAFPATSTAAAVGTRDRFAQAYGRFEFRARFAATDVPGAHATLWLYPQGHPYGPWPHSGEVDVAEWFSARPTQVFPSVHYAGEDTKLSTGYDCFEPTASTEFHTYAVEWAPTLMRFYYDGDLCFEHAWTPTAPLVPPQPFDKPFNIVLSQAWGSLWNAPTEMTPTTVTTYVDYVRVWK